MINLERYGEAQAALYRICEIRQDRLAVLRIQLIKPTRRRIDAFVLNGGFTVPLLRPPSPAR